MNWPIRIAFCRASTPACSNCVNIRSILYGCSPTSSKNKMPPLTCGNQGVPSSEVSIIRLPPHNAALRICRSPSTLAAATVAATVTATADLPAGFPKVAAAVVPASRKRRGRGRRQPVPWLRPLQTSSKQASMISSGSVSLPKSSISIGPAQLGVPVFSSSAHCRALTSLKPSHCVPFLVARARRLKSI